MPHPLSVIATAPWTISKKRDYLILALESEKSRHRRKQIKDVLDDMKLRVLKQEMRGHHDRA